MRSLLFGLATLSVCAVAKSIKPFSGYTANYTASEYYPNETEWQMIENEVAKYNISIDWAAVEKKANEVGDLLEAVDDRWQAYEEYEANYNREQALEIQTALQDTYKNTLGKLMMEYGTLVDPLVNNTEKLGNGLDVVYNASCDSACAMQCWVPEKFDTYSEKWVFGYNATCFNGCGCQFNFQTYNKTERTKFNKNANNVEDDLEDIQKYVEQMNKDAQNIIVPALERYNERASALQNEYIKTVRATAIYDLGCNETCVNTCTNQYYYCFYQMSSCLSHCYCQSLESALQLEEGTYSMPEMVLYAKGNHQALKSFYSLKSKF